MTFQAGFIRGLLIVVSGIYLSGCTPSGSGPLDEEKEPHFLAGKSRISTLDYKGAEDSFERALEVNPQSASAHFELAWIFDQKDVDPAAAIYHYAHYLRLRPKAQNADLARQRIMICKQALAETVSLGPVTEKMQRQFEQLNEENKRLTEENKRLKDDLEKWTSYAARLQTLTNPVAAAAPAVVESDSRRAAGRAPVAVLAQAIPASGGGAPADTSGLSRSHTVKAGETPSIIARKYGVKLQVLMSANPTVEARHLRVGQVLRIPGS